MSQSLPTRFATVAAHAQKEFDTERSTNKLILLIGCVIIFSSLVMNIVLQAMFINKDLYLGDSLLFKFLKAWWCSSEAEKKGLVVMGMGERGERGREHE